MSNAKVRKRRRRRRQRAAGVALTITRVLDRVEAARAKSELTKAEWGSGPWQDEPDCQEWTYEGVPCLALRNMRWGNWCGYVAVSKGHPWAGKGYGELAGVEVHGQLTFAGATANVWKERGFDWCVGFDCGHSWDLQPAMVMHMKILGMPPPPSLFGGVQEYKPLWWVVAEVESLARQAKAAWRLLS